MDRKNVIKKNRGGRKPKADPSVYRHVFRLTDRENAKLLSMFERSGTANKAKFIVSLLFEREIRTLRIDVPTMDYYAQLTKFYEQFRAIGINYNQIVKLSHQHFNEKKAAAYLQRLEKQTVEMANLCKEIIQLTKKFETEYIRKERQNDR